MSIFATLNTITLVTLVQVGIVYCRQTDDFYPKFVSNNSNINNIIQVILLLGNRNKAKYKQALQHVLNKERICEETLDKARCKGKNINKNTE